MTQTNWRNKPERTTGFWLTALLLALRLFGRQGVRWGLLPIVTTVYFLIDGSARRASRDFLARVLSAPPGWRQIWYHMFIFATVSVDRILFLSGRLELFDVDIVDEQVLLEVTDGALLMVSHFGSFDALRVLAERNRGLTVHIVLDKQHNAAAFALLQQVNPAMADKVVDAGTAGSALALQCQRLLQDGALVGIMGDRVTAHQRTCAVEFLGGRAEFPLGPWLLAVLLQRPVILCFGTFLGGNRYRLAFERIEVEQLSGRTAARAEAALQDFVSRLGGQVHRAPYNWFNFYDFFLPA